MATKNIVLLHGWGAETKKLEPLKNELEKMGWKVLLPKLVGFEKPAPKNVWGIKEYSDYVYEESKRKFGEAKFFVFGHSFGGGVAIKLASGNPKILSGVILCATRGISRGRGVKRLVFNALAKTGKVLLITPKIADKFRILLYKAAKEHDYEKTQGIMREVFKRVISEDLKPLVSKIKVPALILWGRKDKTTPLSDAFFLKNALNSSELIIFNDESHGLPYNKPKEIVKEIEKWHRSLS